MNVSIKGVWRTVGAAALVLGMSSQAQAATISFNTAGGTVSIPGLTGFQTLGDDMVGMTVTAYFGTDPGVSAIWAATGAGAGAATSGLWSLSLSGDTFGADWSFTNTQAGLLTRLTLDGSTGLTVFDRTFTGEGTPGSANGADFSTAAGGTGNIAVTYLNPVAVSPNGPVGDLFQIVDINFTGLTNGGIRESFTFGQDTDNDSRLLQTPEPGMLALFGMGLAGLARARRRVRG